MRATHEQVVRHFVELNKTNWTPYNWGCDSDRPSRWDVGDVTYINGVAMTIDRDYHMGYLLEVCHRGTPPAIEYVAIVCFHGWHRETGEWDHAAEWYPGETGTFFERAVSQVDIHCWGVQAIYALLAEHG